MTYVLLLPGGCCVEKRSKKTVSNSTYKVNRQKDMSFCFLSISEVEFDIQYARVKDHVHKITNNTTGAILRCMHSDKLVAY